MRGQIVIGFCQICKNKCKLTNKWGGRRKTCGNKKCILLLNKLTHPKNKGKCVICKKDILSNKYGKINQTCSIKCLKKIQSKNSIKNESKPPSRKGVLNSKAKHKFVDSNGYSVIVKGAYRNYEHRHIVEKIINRKLKQNEHIHHKDGNKLNNNILNLEIISPSAHGKLHHPYGRIGK